MAGNQIYFQLLNPMVMLVFSIGFYAIYYKMQHLRSARLMSIGYFLIGATALGVFFTKYLNPTFSSHLLQAMAIGGVSLLCFGITLRAARPFPLKSVITLYLFMIPAITWYKFFEPDLLVRLALLNLCTGLIFLMTAWSIRTDSKNKTNRVLFWLLVVFAAQMIVRMPAAILYLGDEATTAEFISKGLSLAMNFNTVFIYLVLAMTLFIALGMDIVEDLHEQTLTDPLSELFNRRGFMMRADTMIAGHERDGLPLSLIVCDIDHFKLVNDLHGHDTGDKVIKQLAELLNMARRKSDVCARIGGEEFCILLWNTDISGAKLLANALCSQVPTIEYSGQSPNHPITASFGVAQLDEGENYHQLFRRADYALYEAKNLGRNRVCECKKQSIDAETDAEQRQFPRTA